MIGFIVLKDPAGCCAENRGREARERKEGEQVDRSDNIGVVRVAGAGW